MSKTHILGEGRKRKKMDPHKNAGAKARLAWQAVLPHAASCRLMLLCRSLNYSSCLVYVARREPPPEVLRLRFPRSAPPLLPQRHNVIIMSLSCTMVQGPLVAWSTAIAIAQPMIMIICNCNPKPRCEHWPHFGDVTFAGGGQHTVCIAGD